MDTLSILLGILFKNINYIFPVVLLYLLIGFVGFSCFTLLAKKKNWMLALSGGAILGNLSLIIYLGLLSHFLKGKGGISIIFSIFLLSGIYLFTNFSQLLSLRTYLEGCEEAMSGFPRFLQLGKIGGVTNLEI